MNALELFCGTKSFGKEAVKRNINVVSLDFDKQHQPTICVDILKWDYTIYPRGFFHIIWASPDCTSWSIMTHKHRTLKEGMTPKTDTAVIGEKLICKTLEIIKYFQPFIYFIENPRGRLRHYPLMDIIPHRTTLYYSNYGWHFVKPTDIWSNVELWEETRDRSVKTTNMKKLKGENKITRSRIPQGLINKILDHILY